VTTKDQSFETLWGSELLVNTGIEKIFLIDEQGGGEMNLSFPERRLFGMVFYLKIFFFFSFFFFFPTITTTRIIRKSDFQRFFNSKDSR
jgi:hypothetical protein